MRLAGIPATRQRQPDRPLPATVAHSCVAHWVTRKVVYKFTLLVDGLSGSSDLWFFGEFGEKVSFSHSETFQIRRKLTTYISKLHSLFLMYISDVNSLYVLHICVYKPCVIVIMFQLSNRSLYLEHGIGICVQYCTFSLVAGVLDELYSQLNPLRGAAVQTRQST